MSKILRHYRFFLRAKTGKNQLQNNRINFFKFYESPRTRLSLEAVQYENYNEIVLAHEPSARDNYYLYDQIVSLVEGKGFRIYSPHNYKGSEIEKIDFMINEAIPKAKGSLIHISPITENVKLFFYEICRKNIPFLMFYNKDSEPFNGTTLKKIKESSNFFGEIKYISEVEAINLLEERVEAFLEASRK